MGNCLPKLRKNKVGHDPGVHIQGTRNRTENISEILSMFFTSPSKPRGRTKDEDKMVENLVCPDEDMFPCEVEAEVMNAEETQLAELHGDAPVVKKPVFFQVDFVQRMRNMPPRLASRMGQKTIEKKCEQMKLTDEDELMMDEIMEEYDRKEKLKELEDQLKAADSLRHHYLQIIKDKARRKRSRPPTRACESRVD